MTARAKEIVGDGIAVSLHLHDTRGLGIANMVAGDAKKRFPKGKTTISVPSVVIGKHQIAFPKGVPIISIPCETDQGAFAIDVALKIQ